MARKKHKRSLIPVIPVNVRILTSEEIPVADFLTPSIDSVPPISPENRLLLAILQRAVNDLYEVFDNNNVSRISARRWLNSDNLLPFSFRFIAGHLGFRDWQIQTIRQLAKLSPDEIRRKCLSQVRWKHS